MKDPARAKFGIGQPVLRVEDARFLIGRGRFVDDLSFPRQAHGATVLSAHAHARIARVDSSKALQAPGVLCVLTGADVVAEQLGGLPPLFMPEDSGGPKGYRTRRPLLAHDKVRCVGDRVAFVVAETLEQARDAGELVEVDYEPLPAAVSVEDAVSEGAAPVWEECPGNVSFTLSYGDAQATERAFADAHCVVSLKLVNNRVSANPLEPRGAVGLYEAADDTYTLHTSSQNPHQARTALASFVFKRPVSSFRVVAHDVGGGFGLKTNPFPEEGLVLWASRRIGRPVKWIALRSEALASDNHGRDQVARGELALDAGGRLLALRVRALHGLGAFVFSSATAPVQIAMLLGPNAYRLDAADLVTRAVFMNTIPLAAYRGAGRPEACYLIERLLEEAAQRFEIDSVEIRRRNFIPPAAMPYRTPTGCTYDSGNFEQTMDQCLELAGWSGFEARRAASAKRGFLRGRGMSYFIEQAGVFNERMGLRFDPGGTLTIVAGTFSHGQGHATTYAQMASEWLGVPFESIRFVQGDTAQVPIGRGTFAARSALLGGNALKKAADEVIAKAKPMAAQLLEAAQSDIEFEEGSFRVAGTDKAIALVEVAKAFYRPMGLDARFEVGLEASGSWAADPPGYPNGCHVCEAEVDAETGRVRIDRYTAVDDVGRVINPMICEGQIQGGIAQGIGQALLEAVVYERESGQLLSGSFADYAMPRADDFPAFALAFNEKALPKTSPIGVKGAGESGAVGAPPAVINAILDALRPLGVGHIDMPATPERVWRAIREAQR